MLHSRRNQLNLFENQRENILIRVPKRGFLLFAHRLRSNAYSRKKITIMSHQIIHFVGKFTLIFRHISFYKLYLCPANIHNSYIN